MGQRVLITGAAGFIGQALSERLRDSGNEVTGVDLKADADRGIVAGSTIEPDSWSDRLDGRDLVVHTAAVVSLHGDPEDFWRVNVLGTRRTLAACAEAGVKRFVHLSSVAAFGFDFPDGVDETYPVRTCGVPYVDTKVAGEQVVLQAHAAGEIDVTVVRPGDVYGPRSRPWTIEPIQMLKRRQMLLPDGGRGIFSPVYIDNLVDGLLAAATKDAGRGQVFTISDGVGLSNAEFFGRYARMIGKRKVPTAPAALLRPLARLAHGLSAFTPLSSETNPDTIAMLSRRGTYSIEKARTMLGYEPAVGIEQGFARTEAWLRAEGLL